MHFSSSSWGVFSSTKDYERRIEEKLEQFSQYDQFLDLNDTYQDIAFDSIQIEDSLNRQLYQIALEGLELAIASEEYSIDTSIINKILVEPAHLYDLEDLRVDKINLKLDYEENKVALKSSTTKYFIELEDFKYILVQCVSGEEGKRLEDTDDFKNIVSKFLEVHLKDEKSSKKKLFVGQKTNFETGLGLIIDKTTQREVGTFERMTLNPDRKSSHLDFQMKHMILDGISLEVISSKAADYLFVYYSLEDDTVYSFHVDALSHTYSHEIDSNLHATKVRKVEIEALDNMNNKYSLIQEAQPLKQTIKDLDLKDPLDQMKYEKFKSHRSSIIQAGKEAAKKEKIYNQFADLELDF